MIQLSPASIAEIHRLMAKAKHPHPCLRLRVQTGGCSGYYYDLSIETLDPNQSLQPISSLDVGVDTPYLDEQGGINILVDPSCAALLDGLFIDYSEDLMGGGFRFHNPNAASTCGCSLSFSPTADSV
ncbi:MAG: iron-sulfur cluster assembly accessory protein [Kaiparowitsia implicata GSE-PSE-MK54-09C]|jgi:iron-sulfur cluster assembly accessory protein|nr:iron-sulfur cluster assembly accessory protein [Kaiparowitsia implicata GSE-PSE-MK54-09C]